jgi:hypothetical protein
MVTKNDELELDNQVEDQADETIEEKLDGKKFLKFRSKKKEVKEEVEATSEETLEEKAEAPKTHPSAAAGASKMAMVSSLTNAMAAMSKSDMEEFFNKMMNSIGDYGQKDNSAKNRASVEMHGGATSAKNAAIKEDIEELFSDETITEEFKEKATTLFEAVVASHVAEIRMELEEAFETKLAEEVEKIAVEMHEQVEDHLNYVTEKWYEDNEVAIESQIRADIMESFIDGLKNLFLEHNIDIPSEAVDVVESLTAKNDELENSLNDIINENIELKKALSEVDKQTVFYNVAEGLSVTQVEKLRTLAEGVEFNGDTEAYGKKLKVVKEFMLKDKTKKVEESTTPTGVETLTEQVDASVKRYSEALSRTLKK